ncbi:MAG TPA: hypothetical protein VFZ61_24495, partial [Polyangiales bacterium]
SAAVLGLDFVVAQLAAVVEQSASEVLAGLETCVAEGVMLEGEAATYRFAHPTTRDAAYQLVTPSDRCRLHRLAGEWLERSAVDARGTRYNELAHHFYRAAPEIGSIKAVHYALRCAELAYAATAYEYAITHYDRALACMDLDPARTLAERLDVALLRAEALRASAADTTTTNALFFALAEQAERLGEPALLARAVLGYTGQRELRFTPTRFAPSSNVEEITLIERALHTIGPAHTAHRALLLCSLMGALVYTPRKERRDSAGQEATRIARDLADPAVLVRVLTTKYYCCPQLDNPRVRVSECDELIAVAEQHGLRHQLMDALITRALAKLTQGDVEGAATDEQRAKRLAATSGTPQARARSQLIELMRAFWSGDVALARRLTEAAYAVTREDLAERAHFLMRSATLRFVEGGQVSEYILSYETMLRAYPDAVGLHCALSSCHATLGSRELALHHFETVARDDFQVLPKHLGWLGEMALLADACAWLDDAERARRVYTKLERFGHVFDFFMGETAPSGPVAHWLAGLAATCRDLPLARRWVEVSYELNHRVGAIMLAQYTKLVEARIEQLSGATGRPRALALLQEVRAFAQPRGLAWLVHCAEIRRESIEAGPTAPTTLSSVRQLRVRPR